MMADKALKLAGIAGILVALKMKKIGVHGFYPKVECRCVIMQKPCSHPIFELKLPPK